MIVGVNTLGLDDVPYTSPARVGSAIATVFFTEFLNNSCSSGFTPGATDLQNCAHCVVR